MFKARLAISWNGLPHYAARLIRQARLELCEEIAVVGSKPQVPARGMEEELGSPITWTDADKHTTWKELGLQVPSVFFQSGWGYKCFRGLGNEVRKNGGVVYLMMDNDWRASWRQIVASIVMRRTFQKQFQGVFCPGEAAAKYAEKLGFEKKAIWKGMYGADPGTFSAGPPLHERSRQILYVGQFIERKACIELSRSFDKIANNLPGWKLVMIGSGPLQSRIKTSQSVQVLDFMQPWELSKWYRNSRIFILPSRTEAWGLVVHEAALSGCQLVLSDSVGARHELAGQENSMTFRSGCWKEMEQCIASLARRNEGQLIAAENQSRELATRMGPQVFAAAISKMTAVTRK